MIEELSFLDSKILSYLKSKRLTTLTYAELETLIRPYKVEDYILTSRILYEPQPGLFKLLPDLEKEILSPESHDGQGNPSGSYRRRKEISGERICEAGKRRGEHSNGFIKGKSSGAFRYGNGFRGKTAEVE